MRIMYADKPPEDFIISRKRKKYRFAKFAQSSLCFESDEWQQQSVDVVEIGAGNGMFSVDMAERHPELFFVAVDVKGDRLQYGAYKAEERGIFNIAFVRARADEVGDLFPDKTVSSLWLTFSDPFPKKGSARRRLTHPDYLQKYKKMLAHDGVLYIKHDNPAFFQWSLEQLVSERWSFTELSFNLHDSTLDDIYKIKTAYELRWLDEGRITQFVAATKGEQNDYTRIPRQSPDNS